VIEMEVDAPGVAGDEHRRMDPPDCGDAGSTDPDVQHGGGSSSEAGGADHEQLDHPEHPPDHGRHDPADQQDRARRGQHGDARPVVAGREFIVEPGPGPPRRPR
jgi:hypothetical protein